MRTGLRIEGRSAVGWRMDPRWQLAALFLCGVAVLCLQTVPAAMVAFVATLLLLSFCRVPWAWFLTRLGGVAAFLALLLVLLPFTLGEPKIDVGPISLSAHGLELAALIALKTLTCVSLVLLLFASCPFEITLQAAHDLHVPGLAVQLLMLTYRYVDLLADELGKVRVALRVRAYRNRATSHCYRTIGNVTGTLLVRSYERAERVSQAMRCRGFDGRFRSLHRFATRPADVLLFITIILLVAGLPLFVEFGPPLIAGEGP
jgi:cobalt/nickel transport system permease protein